MVNAIIKKALRLFLGEYSAYYVFRLVLPGTGAVAGDSAATIARIDKSVILEHRETFGHHLTNWYAEGVFAYGYFSNSRLAGICAYVDREHNPQESSWPLRQDEVMLVQIVTLPDMRKHGVAKALIRRSATLVSGEGFRRAYARVWHSNTPSLRAFASAGWERTALVIEVNPLRRKSPFRLKLGMR